MPNEWIACKEQSTKLLIPIDVCLAVIVILYCLQLGYIFKERKNVAVQTRSPKILLLGGLSLMTDSIINFAIQFSKDDNTQCIMGIATTVIFFYLGWSCIALRAYRIKAVFDTYE